MKWRSTASFVLRRRAVVGGLAVDAAGRPWADASALSLSRTEPPRRFRCRLRNQGRFYFVDVPPGDYTLDWRDGAGAWVPQRPVTVPPFASDAPRTVVHLDVLIVDPAGVFALPRPI